MNILYSPHKIQKFREMHNRHLNWAISSLIIKNEQHTIMMRKKTSPFNNNSINQKNVTWCRTACIIVRAVVNRVWAFDRIVLFNDEFNWSFIHLAIFNSRINYFNCFLNVLFLFIVELTSFLLRIASVSYFLGNFLNKLFSNKHLNKWKWNLSGSYLTKIEWFF
jgi:hypothetical protein